MEIEVSKKNALVSERIHIKISDLKTDDKIKVTAEMELPWCKGEVFSSYAVFTADKKGCIDMDKDIPLEGSYHTPNSMGLIYSLKKSKTKGKSIVENLSVGEPITIKITAISDNERKEVYLGRLFKNDDIIKQDIHETEFNGVLFHNKKVHDKTILMLNGSDGNMSALELLAAPFASYGFNVLMVPYFAAEGLPDKLDEVPIDYFENVFAWIRNNEICGQSEVMIHGTSKGGELALLLASKYKEVKKVVAVSPHEYCFQALNGTLAGRDVSSWTYNGTDLPFIALDNNVFFEEVKQSIEKGVSFGCVGTYMNGINKAANREEARIKIEDSEADILVVAGKDDMIWNSCDGCMDMAKRMNKPEYKNRFHFLSYENMGHSIPVPNVIPLSEIIAIPMMGGIFSPGGTIEGNATAQQNSWEKTIEFFK